jgi:hypothetical protein
MTAVKRNAFLMLTFLFMAFGCQQQETGNTGRIAVKFHHLVNGSPLVTDDMRYTNKAGNDYEVSEIQWFVSDLTLHSKGGSSILLDPENFAHYVDTDIQDTHLWDIEQEVPVDHYESISITFGIKGEKNQPYMYTDSPESEMIWPINLGGDKGGYHYMKLNGFWKNDVGERNPFNFHLGVGQERNAAGAITGFIQNWFEVVIPIPDLVIRKEEKMVINLAMNVDQWFDDPNIYDHNHHGAKIMQNQEAMRMGTENGKSGVFTVNSIEKADLIDQL